MTSNVASLLPDVASIARRAGAAILDVYSGKFDVAHKADSSPLTIADMRSHEIIVHALRELTPNVPVLSEEASDVPFDERSTWTRYWLVDPLDGTKEFVSRNGEFTVNIALIEDHVPTLGVVFVPVRDTLYMGTRSEGAKRQVGSDAATEIGVTRPAATPLRIVGSRSHRDGRLEAYLPKLEPYELVSIGSSLKFCLIAEGSADFYPRLGPTSEWDTAAAQAVVEATGGAVTTLDGKPLRYNTKADILNPNFLVFGDTERDWVGIFNN
jgi:3'(2'),5'-bisphosphate nucleotidase (EC 3.1.3.7)